MEQIKYHPLVSCDTKGFEKMPMFCHTDEGIIREKNDMYLSEFIPGYYRLKSKKPQNKKTVSKLVLHCPKCGSVLKAFSRQFSPDRLPLYTCSHCNKH